MKAVSIGSIILSAAMLAAALVAQAPHADPRPSHDPSPSSWIKTGTTKASAVATDGYVGLFAATRTSDTRQTGAMTPAIVGHAENDNVRQLQSSYGVYGEARRFAGAGITQGSEFNVMNAGSVVDVTPYGMSGNGLTAAGWLSCGRTDVPSFDKPCSVGAAIVNNGRPFRSGFVVFHDALDPRGPMNAFAMAKDQNIAWYDQLSGGPRRVAYATSRAVTATRHSAVLGAVDDAGSVVEVGLNGAGNDSFAPTVGSLDLGSAVSGWSSISMQEVGAASVQTPKAGVQTLFIDTADHKLKRKDSKGVVTIIG